MIISIDFDETIIERTDNVWNYKKYQLKPNCKSVLNKWVEKKYTLLLNTARYYKYYLPMMLFIKKENLPVKICFFRKPYADIYIDDKNLGQDYKNINWLNIEEMVTNIGKNL